MILKFTSMHFYIFNIFLFVILFLSCKNHRTQNSNDSKEIFESQNQNGSDSNIDFKLSDYPQDIIKNYELESWDEFKNLHNLLNQLRILDFRNVDLEILKLNKILKNLLSKKLPEKFEKPQIRSRLKVVFMQSQKSYYFTKHFKEDSLISSLEELYKSYNSMISRMNNLEDELQEFDFGETEN